MTIALVPDSDGDCTTPLRKALRRAIEPIVTIDLHAVPQLSASALAELATFTRRHHEQRIVLQRPSAMVLRTLNVVGMSRLFTIEAC